MNEAEKEAVNDIDAANERLTDGTTRLANSISSSAVDQQGVKVASLMIETTKENLEKARTKLASVRDKQIMLSVKNKRLIGRALPGLPSRKRMLLLRVKSLGKKKKTG